MFSPMMSLVRVMKGPVAKAGSIFILWSRSGNAVPKIEAKRMTTKRDKVTVIGMAKVFNLKNRVYRKRLKGRTF